MNCNKLTSVDTACEIGDDIFFNALEQYSVTTQKQKDLKFLKLS